VITDRRALLEFCANYSAFWRIELPQIWRSDPILNPISDRAGRGWPSFRNTTGQACAANRGRHGRRDTKGRGQSSSMRTPGGVTDPVLAKDNGLRCERQMSVFDAPTSMTYALI